MVDKHKKYCRHSIVFRRACEKHTANSWQAKFGRFGRLKLFSIFCVHGKLKVLGHKSRTAACHQIVMVKFKRYSGMTQTREPPKENFDSS
jgi:hypothetical protein